MYLVLKEIGIGTDQLLPGAKIPDEMVTSRMKELGMVEKLPADKPKPKPKTKPGPKPGPKPKTKKPPKPKEEILTEISSDVIVETE